MTLHDYLGVLRRRWKLITLAVLLCAGAAYAVSAAATPIYAAKARLFVAARSGGGVSEQYAGGLFTQQRVKSYAQMVDSEAVAAQVVDDLSLDLPAAALAGKVTATAPLDTVLIDVTARDPDPKFAQQLAYSFASSFADTVDDLEPPTADGLAPVKVTVYERAKLPVSPVEPRTKLNVALGLVLGGLLGAGGALLREALDTSIKSLDRLGEATGTTPLGAVAFDAKSAKRPVVVQAEPLSPAAESYRQLRTNIRFVDVDEHLRSLVVTSAVAGEGKSTISCNLAVAMAQSGARVILVEADLRRPSLSSYLGIEGSVGLTNVLIGEVSLDDALQSWGGGLLQVLPGGSVPPNPSELLGSHAMHDLRRELESRCEFVLFDAPPLLPVTDAAVLAADSGGAVPAVRAGSTSTDQARRAVDTLRGVGAKLLGAVLSMAPAKGPDAGYYYQYGSHRRQADDPEVTMVLPTPAPDQVSATPASPEPVAASEPPPPPVSAPAPYPPVIDPDVMRVERPVWPEEQPAPVSTPRDPQELRRRFSTES